MYEYYGTAQELPLSTVSLFAALTSAAHGTPTLTYKAHITSFSSLISNGQSAVSGRMTLSALARAIINTISNLNTPRSLSAIASFMTFGRFGKTAVNPVTTTDDPIPVSGKLTLTGQ